MSRRMLLGISVILVLALSGISLYLHAAGGRAATDMDQQIVLNTGLEYIQNGPTFKFDGIAENLRVKDYAILESLPLQHVVTIVFECRQSGYGDRTGLFLAQVITPHEAVVVVIENRVVSAIIDGKWDEVNQRMVENTWTKEEAERIALDWLRNCPTFRFDGVPETVRVQRIEPLLMVDAWEVWVDFTCNYPGYGDRTGRTMLGMTQNHTIRITVVGGNVTNAVIDNIWDEMRQQRLDDDESELITVEMARDISVNYVLAKYLPGLPVPTVWITEEMTHQDLLGLHKVTYIAGQLNVTIEHAVVWKPTYTVFVEFLGDSPLTWRGTVNQDRSVLEDGLLKSGLS